MVTIESLLYKKEKKKEIFLLFNLVILVEIILISVKLSENYFAVRRNTY